MGVHHNRHQMVSLAMKRELLDSVIDCVIGFVLGTFVATVIMAFVL